MDKFPRVLAAIEQLEKSKTKHLWTLADALIAECGGDDDARRRASSHAKNGSGEKLAQCVAMLVKHGYEYEAQTLRNIRDAGITFPKDRRYPGISLWIHLEAGSPDFLDGLVKKYGLKGGRMAIGVRKVRELRLHAIETERRAREKKKAAAEARFAKAASVEEARQAKEEIRDNTGPPKGRDLKSEHVEHPLHEMARTAEISLHLRTATRTLRDDMKALRKIDINPELVEGMVDECNRLLDVVTQLKSVIEGEDRPGLTVMEGGKQHA